MCSPSAAACYTAVSKNITGCSVSCTGLYADVQFTEDKLMSPGSTMEAVQVMWNELWSKIQVLASVGEKVYKLSIHDIIKKL